MANTHLTRTFGSATAQQTWTMSFWLKRSQQGSTGMIAFCTGANSNNNWLQVALDNNDNFYLSGYSTQWLKTNRKFRDPNAWYHFVIQADSPQSTASNRLKVYVNGEEITSFSIDNRSSITQSQTWGWNRSDGYVHYIGSEAGNGGFFNGSISHFHFADGSVVAPTVFGETDATTGEWKIITSPSFTLGNNGFPILKDGNTVTDQSSNSNDWTVAQGTLTKTEDSPSNNFCTLNANDMVYGNSSLTHGNNTQNQTAASGHYAFINGTLGFNSGKWYWEMKCVSGHSDNWYGVGITSTQCTAANNYLGQNADSYAIYGYSYGGGLASSYTGGTRTNQGASFTAGDIIGVAVDCDNMAIYFSKNGTWMSNASSVQGVPTSGSSKTGSFFTISDPATRKYNAYGGFYLPSICYFDARTAVQSVNFGNGYFGTTAVSSAGTNASGNGIFEYDVPTGYTALCTKGLNS